MSILATCDEGCGKQFEVTEMPVTKLDDGIEKTSFTCEHCGREYVGFYTDKEIRGLQVRLRRIQRRFADPSDNHIDAQNKEANLREQIKEKMAILAKSVESKKQEVNLNVR